MRARRGMALAVGLLACTEVSPPGAAGAPGASPSGAVAREILAAPSPSRVPSPPGDPPSGASPGSPEDSLPFDPAELRVASTASRTWVYSDVGPARTRYGYLRAGAILPARGPELRNEGCAGGWYRVNPRGFVCVGHGATLDLRHPTVVASARRPLRGEGLPYAYALARSPGPHAYFRLPSAEEMRAIEGPNALARAAARTAALAAGDALAPLGPLEPPPEFLPRGGQGGLEKPYGAARALRRASGHSGRTGADAGFALLGAYQWEGRAFALTTELDLLPVDGLRVVRPSTVRGVALSADQDLPVAIARNRFTPRYVERAPGVVVPGGTLEYREVLALTGRRVTAAGVTFLETPSRGLVAEGSVQLVERRASFPSVAEGRRRWIDVSIRDQTLVAYEGTRASYVALVSTGQAGLADPSRSTATVRGTFMIHAKHVTSTMDGEEDRADSTSLGDVPFVQYFHRGYALHAAYWHDDFGKPRSHGCINLAPADAAFLFEWTEPAVPPGWHGVLNKERGTPVVIRP